MSEISVIEHIHDMQQRWSPQASGQFTSLMHDLVLSAKIISRSVTKAGLLDVLGGTGSINVQGEHVQKLDEFANDVMIYRMINSGAICALGSEEEQNPIFVSGKRSEGKYIIFFDPLDGSSNIDVNINIGTIFSIYRIADGESLEHEHLLRKGSEQVAAGYFLYGPSTMLVYSTGHGVHGFTLDPSVGEFLLSHSEIITPEKGPYYSANLTNYSRWNDSDKRASDTFSQGDYSLRYVGSLVADFHRTLLYGGLFTYPADKKNSKGKLRLVYEAAPLAFLMEQAGGQALDSDGMRVVEKMPDNLHERTALVFGSRLEVDKYRAAF